MGYLIGETKNPTSTITGATQRWTLENSRVTAWLGNSMSPPIGKTYMFLPTVKDKGCV